MYENYERIIKMKGLTNYKVSKDTGIAQSVLSNWKTKGAVPKVDKLQILAGYLDVTIDQLIGVQTDEQEPGYYLSKETVQYAQEIFETPGMRVLFDAAKDSRPEDLQMAADLLTRLKATNRDG